MAKYRAKKISYRTRTVNKIKRVGKRYGGKAKGFMPMVHGAIAGAITPIAQKYLGKWGQPAALGVTGYMTGNETLETLAGYQVGLQIGSGLGNITGTGTDTTTTSGGFY